MAIILDPDDLQPKDRVQPNVTVIDSIVQGLDLILLRKINVHMARIKRERKATPRHPCLQGHGWKHLER
jgi:hypothetical protein